MTALFFGSEGCNSPAVTSPTGVVHSGDNQPAKITRRIKGHRLISLPDEPVRIWQTLTTTVCHAPIHDTLDAYNQTCRCPTAIRAQSQYAKKIRARGNSVIDATVTRQQLQSLAAAGHACPAISAATGISHDRLQNLRLGRATQTLKRTARRIDQYWRANRHVDGGSARARTEAARHGWPLPSAADLCVIDEVKVARARAGEISALSLNSAEKRALRQRNTA